MKSGIVMAFLILQNTALAAGQIAPYQAQFSTPNNSIVFLKVENVLEVKGPVTSVLYMQTPAQKSTVKAFCQTNHIGSIVTTNLVYQTSKGQSFNLADFSTVVQRFGQTDTDQQNTNNDPQICEEWLSHIADLAREGKFSVPVGRGYLSE